jgi:serine/threonine-protein kinase
VDPSSTRFVPDGPARDTSGLRELIARYDVDLPTFGRFRADALLGVGAMGTVYRAHDDVLGRDVAIKALRASSEVGVRERFLREARAVGAILHPNILAIYDAATHAGTPYLVMELATDGSLRDRIQQGPLEPDRVRELGIQIAQALAAAHGKSILHRDIKPANILATQQGVATQPALAAEQGRRNTAKQGAWKLADFGIARMPDSTMTVDGQFVGSPSYAAPESLRAGQFSPASDVYGLAATLYEAVTGVPPQGDHDMTSVVKKLDQDPPPVTARRAGVPAPIADAIMQGLARDPARRPSAKDLAALLARTDADMVPAGPSRRLKLLAAALATAALVMVAFVARSKWPARSTAPAGPNEAATPTERVPARSSDRDVAREDPPGTGPFAKPPNAGALEGALPQVVDEDGNPVDDETAKRILEQMERDAHEEAERWKKPKKKKRGRDRWLSPDPWAPRQY